jgi:hypothetical protein
MPGMVAPAAVAIATGNPIGLIVVGGMKVRGQASGRNTLEGRAKATADARSTQDQILGPWLDKLRRYLGRHTHGRPILASREQLD